MYRPSLKERMIDGYRIIRHVVLFYFYTLRGLFCRQRLSVPNKQLTYTRKYCFSTTRKLKWFKLYGVSSEQANLRFSYRSPIVVRSFLYLTNKLHINYKNLLHLQYDETCFDPMGIRPNQTYVIESALTDIIKLRSTMLALRINTTISDKQGKLYLSASNVVFVKGITDEDLLELNRSAFYGNVEDRSLLKLALKKPKLLANKPETEFVVPKKMGVRYGLVSGDMNFIHTSKLFAKLLGFKNIFIQGMCTVNYLTCYLLTDPGASLKCLKITFTNPIYEGQTIQLWRDGNQFEITSSEHKLLAYGEIE